MVKKKSKKETGSRGRPTIVDVVGADSLIERLKTLAKGSEFVDTKILKEVFGCHQQSIYRYVQQGAFKSYRTYGQRSVYKVREVEQFIRDRSKPKARRK